MSTASPINRAHVLHLYRSFLKAGDKFSNYNFRDYVKRRARDAFKEAKNETDPTSIKRLVEKAEHELAIVQRQSQLSQLYGAERLVVEDWEGSKKKSRIRERGPN